MMPPTVRVVASKELVGLLPALVELLRESVNGGASLGFLPPLTHHEARRYWLSLGPELRGGSRLLFAAYVRDRLVGSGQLTLPSWPTARHRAELNKVMVTTALRGHGIGRTLLHAIHDTAWQRGRSLLLLNARRGDPAETFYRRLGYREAGVVPGYMIGAAGETYDNVAMYRPLRPEGDVGAGSRDGQSSVRSPLRCTCVSRATRVRVDSFDGEGWTMSTRTDALADRLEQGARELAAFAAGLTPAEWQTPVPRDGRTVGVIVHHVATMYPLEIQLAQRLAGGGPISGVTWDVVHELNAAHAKEYDGVTKAVALELLERNSAAAAAAIRGLSDRQLDQAAPVSLNADAPLTCQFFLEDHAVRHSYHHLDRLRGALRPQATTALVG